MESKSILKKKFDYWKKKLIDLSKRNNLVSYRFTKSKSIKIIEPQISQLLADLYDEKNIFFAKTKKSELKDRLWRCSEEERQKVREDLLKYCALDTWAEVLLVKKLKELTN